MIRNVAAQSSYATSSLTARQQTQGEKMMGESVDQKFRERILKDLAKLPPCALSKLQEAGWKIEMMDAPRQANGCKNGGLCCPSEKVVKLDRALYEKDKDGKILLHEMAHALDFKGHEAPGLLRKLLGVKGAVILGTDRNPTFAATYQKFQAQHMVSIAQVALKEEQTVNPATTQVAFETAFQGGMHAALMHGKLLVFADPKKAANQARSKDVETAVGPMPKDMVINGVEVKNTSHEEKGVTIVDQKDAARLSTSWTDSDSYVASSNLPSELYAEGVAAYLGSPESRRQLQLQSPDVHAFVEKSMNEFLIAGPHQVS